jgi:outer membrane protein assembly factor BamB
MNDRLKAFEWNGSQFNPVPISQSDEKTTSPRPGGFLTLSAQGQDPPTAILWALQPTGDANQAVVPGVLRAFNATDLKQEVWNSKMNAARDDVGKYAKFCPPVVANGRVYIASFSNQLHVYGLNPRP